MAFSSDACPPPMEIPSTPDHGGERLPSRDTVHLGRQDRQNDQPAQPYGSKDELCSERSEDLGGELREPKDGVGLEQHLGGQHQRQQLVPVGELFAKRLFYGDSVLRGR